MKQNLLTNFGKTIVTLMLLALPLFAFSQVRYTIKGKVSDSDGQPLIGATVNLGGTLQGASTDIDGNYMLSGAVKEGPYSLVFSYLGYAAQVQSITIGEATKEQMIDISLKEDRMNLDEVVVTGSTLSSTRRQLGNAVSTVSGDVLTKSGTGNALAALSGRVAGARITQTSGDPAGGINVNLRGVNSIRGSSDPLYVIDGVIVSNAGSPVSQLGVSAGEAAIGTNRLADINPNDIENVTVLNGAAAAAIYGSRAANGVVVITTKRGEAGKPKITVGTSVTLSQLRKKVYISTYGKQFGWSALRLGNITSVSAAQITANAGSKVDTVKRDGAFAYLTKNTVDVTRYDYQDYIFQDAMGTDNFINVSGGNDKTKYTVGLSYMKNEGIIKNTDFNRYALKLNLDQQLASWATVSFGTNIIRSGGNEMANGNVFFSPINGINITNNIWKADELDGNGNLKSVEPTRINPVSTVETFKFNQQVTRNITNAKLSLFPLTGLRLDLIAGLDAFSQLGRQYIPIYPYDGVGAANYPNGFASTGNNMSFQYNNDINLTYEKAFGKITSTTVAGYNYQYGQTDFTSSTGEGLAPGISTVNGAAVRATGYGLDRFSLSGAFAQQTFGYNNSLFLTVAGRVDNSSKFSLTEGNQFYPKASLSYVVSDLWKGQNLEKTLSSVKLRASFGEAGGLTAIGSYDRFYQLNSIAYLGKNTILPGSQLANPLVKPERTKETEFGIDLGLFNNRVTLSATAYDQKVSDLLADRVLASSEGGTSIVNNVGEMTNKGVELSLNASVVKSKNFQIDVFGIYSKNKNLVTKVGSLANITSPILLNTVSGAPAYIIEGQPVGVFFGTYYATNSDGSHLLNAYGLEQTEKGVSKILKEGETAPTGASVYGNTYYLAERDAGQPKGLNALRKVIGDPNPDFTMSFGSTITWKKLSFNFLIDGAYGQEVFNADRRTRQGVGIGDISEKELKGELKRGYIHSIYPIEEWRIDDGSYTKLREISLSYNFGGLIKGMSDLTISAIGRNLHSWDNYDGYDPETNAGGTSDRLRGVDFGNVPIPRTIQFALKASF
jgi:TonB-linked SusC/RagA family outer membrane protein